MLTSLAEFEHRYQAFSARTLDEAAECAMQVYDYQLTSPPGEDNVLCLLSGSMAPVDDISFIVHRSSCGFEGMMESGDEHYCLAMPLMGGTRITDPVDGVIDFRKNHARIYRKAAGTKLTAPPKDVASFAILIPAQLLEDKARSYFGELQCAPLRFNPHIDLTTPTGQSILGCLDLFQLTLSYSPANFANPLTRTAAKDHLLSTLVSGLEHNYQPGAKQIGQGAIPGVVKRAEEFMHAHAGAPISVDQIARAVGCSERALQSAFKSFRNTTPMRALRDIRLERAHEDLRKSSDTVTSIAFKWGFGNPGRFASSYTEKFGESPSDTLRFGCLSGRCSAH